MNLTRRREVQGFRPQFDRSLLSPQRVVNVCEGVCGLPNLAARCASLRRPHHCLGEQVRAGMRQCAGHAVKCLSRQNRALASMNRAANAPEVLATTRLSA